MNDYLKKRKRNEKKDIQHAENSEKKIEGQLGKLIIEKSKIMINQYMAHKFQRLNAIILKEEEIKKKD